MSGAIGVSGSEPAQDAACAQRAAIAGRPSAAIKIVASLTAGVRFKECRDCPEMIVVPRGEVSVKFADDFNVTYADDVNGARIARSLE